MARSFFLVTMTCCLCVSACSNSKGPKNVEVDCGPPVAPEEVMILDMRDKAREGSLEFDYVEEQAGPFRLYTEQPVGVQKNTAQATEPMPRGTTWARNHAAVRGCDLVLLVSDYRATYGNVSNTWLIHLGKRLP